MIFDEGRQKGILDRSVHAKNVYFHREMTYQQVLDKSIRSIWSDADTTNASFYLANGSGVAIGGEEFDVELPDRTQNVIPWTLHNYLKVSNIKHASRARIYCVMSGTEESGNGEYVK